MQARVVARPAATASRPPAPGKPKHADLMGTASPELSRAGARRVHYPALDGLRGLAFLGVLVFHCQSFLLGGGFVPVCLRAVVARGYLGVDLFFVLSGFLITGILHDSRLAEHRFRNFYARRFLRIFPLYYGVLALLLVSLTAYRLIDPAAYARSHHLPTLWAAQPWLWAYIANFRAVFGLKMPYFDHFWTLSVEEQFYFVWPLIVFSLPRRWLIAACTGIIVGAFALRSCLWHWEIPGWSVIFLTPCRVDTFAAGALVALLFRGDAVSRTRMRLAGWTCIATGAWLFVTLIVLPIVASESAAARGTGISAAQAPLLANFSFTVQALFFASLIALCLRPHRLTAHLYRVFSLRPLRAIGGYSYGMYVFHVAVLVAFASAIRKFPALNHYILHSPLAGLFVIFLIFWVTFAIAAASFHLYEKHFLRLKRYFPEGGPRAAVAAK